MTLDLHELARQYTAAWCSQNAASVAAFFSPEGSLAINDGLPSVGRVAISAAAQEFMTAFPDLKVTMDSVAREDDHAIYRWTLEGHNTGPGGTGAHVRISGYEEWNIGSDGLIGRSLGHFDGKDYQRQLATARRDIPIRRGLQMNSTKRTLGITALAGFFCFGACMSGIAAALLAFPGNRFDSLWRANPPGHEGLLMMRGWAVLLMATVCAACIVAAVGLWRLRSWGLWTALTILTINLAGDTASALLAHDPRTLIGLPIAGLTIGYLLRKRYLFARRNNL